MDPAGADVKAPERSAEEFAGRNTRPAPYSPGNKTENSAALLNSYCNSKTSVFLVIYCLFLVFTNKISDECRKSLYAVCGNRGIYTRCPCKVTLVCAWRYSVGVQFLYLRNTLLNVDKLVNPARKATSVIDRSGSASSCSAAFRRRNAR